MRETDEDLRALQASLDRTYELAGSHLLGIIGPDQRLTSQALAEKLSGYCLLSLATVASSGQPLVSPVDAVFYRGHFYFSTGKDALRRRHIERDPRVSGTFAPRPNFAVTVHGVAVVVDHHTDEMAEFKSVLTGTFVPYFGADFADFVDETPTYYRIDADRIYCYWQPSDA